MDWNSFYLMMAGATATVMGLLFIAVQGSIGRYDRRHNPHYRALALSTFNIFFLDFFIPAFFLIPAIGQQGRACAIFVGVGLGVIGVFRNWLPVFREVYNRRTERAFQMFWHFVSPLLAFFYLAYVAVLMLRGTSPIITQVEIAITLVALFSNGIRNSWNLIVESAFQAESAREKTSLPEAGLAPTGGNQRTNVVEERK